MPSDRCAKTRTDLARRSRLGRMTRRRAVDGAEDGACEDLRLERRDAKQVAEPTWRVRERARQFHLRRASRNCMLCGFHFKNRSRIAIDSDCRPSLS